MQSPCLSSRTSCSSSSRPGRRRCGRLQVRHARAGLNSRCLVETKAVGGLGSAFNHSVMFALCSQIKVKFMVWEDAADKAALCNLHGPRAKVNCSSRMEGWRPGSNTFGIGVGMLH